jgi:O-Antigen ligase
MTAITRTYEARAGRARLTLGRWSVLALLVTVAPTVKGVAPAAGSTGAVHLSDLVLPAVALAGLPIALRTRGVWLPVALGATTIAEGFNGMFHGAATHYLLRDLRPGVYMTLGAVAAICMCVQWKDWRWYVRALAVFLAAVAFLLLISQAMSSPLVGSSQSVSVFYGSSALQLDSSRVQLETDPLALATLCALVGSVVAGFELPRLIGIRTFWALLISSAVVVFLSYSRNSLLGLGVAAIAGLLAPVAVKGGAAAADKLSGTLRTAVTTAIVAVVLAIPAFALVQSGVISSQLETYGTRVLDGLSSAALRSDTSVQWRDVETRLAEHSIARHPLSGIGLGVFYRPYVPGEPFIGDDGRIYVHDYFLSVLVKGGALYLAVIAMTVGGAIVRLLFGRAGSAAERGWRLAAGCGLVALTAVGVVAPWAGQPDGAAIFGALMAAGWCVVAPRVGRPIARSGERRLAADGTA